MPQDSDWRLQGQERYLQGAVLSHLRYRRKDLKSDHDHCEFCWAKFMEEDYPEVLHEGYCTRDSYRCICEGCFADFCDRFHWTLEKDEGGR